MNTVNLPFELSQSHTPSPFICFETRKSQDSWPWHAVQAIHINADKSVLSFEFARHTVEVTGENLGTIETEARSARLKTLREGKGAGVTVKSLLVIGGQ